MDAIGGGCVCAFGALDGPSPVAVLPASAYHEWCLSRVVLIMSGAYHEWCGIHLISILSVALIWLFSNCFWQLVGLISCF